MSNGRRPVLRSLAALEQQQLTTESREAELSSLRVAAYRSRRRAEEEEDQRILDEQIGPPPSPPPSQVKSRRLQIGRLIIHRPPPTIDIPDEKNVIGVEHMISMFQALTEPIGNHPPKEGLKDKEAWIAEMSNSSDKIPLGYIKHGNHTQKAFDHLDHLLAINEIPALNPGPRGIVLIRLCSLLLVRYLHSLNMVPQIWVQFLIDYASMWMTISRRVPGVINQRQSDGTWVGYRIIPILPTWRYVQEMWLNTYIQIDTMESREKIEDNVLGVFFSKVPRWSRNDGTTTTYYQEILYQFRYRKRMKTYCVPFLQWYLEKNMVNYLVFPPWETVVRDPDFETESDYFNIYERALPPKRITEVSIMEE